MDSFYRVKLATVVAICLFLSGCSTISYYSQSIVGHSRLMLARVPLNKATRNADQPLKDQLLLSKQLKAFAIEQLALPNSNSYNSYVALEREFPVWTVVAAPEFSLIAKQWCYLLIGCANYRGYFSQSAAHDYALTLAPKGFETEVSGAPAYSTLGWFADPLLPSMMRFGDTQFAQTLFHEMAHQQLYIKGDSDFNEAFASVVGEAGVIRWLQINNPDGLVAYSNRALVEQQFYTLLSSSKQALKLIYQSKLPRVQMRLEKGLVFKQLRASYELLKAQQWNGREWYKSWFDEELSNAKFAALSTYRQRIPELRTLLIKCDQNLARFYRVLSFAQQVEQKVIVPDNCQDLTISHSRSPVTLRLN